VFELSNDGNGDGGGEPGFFRDMRLRDLYLYIQKIVAGEEGEGRVRR